MKSILGNFYRHSTIFFWSHWQKPIASWETDTRLPTQLNSTTYLRCTSIGDYFDCLLISGRQFVRSLPTWIHSPILPGNQCGQIWRNFTTSEQCYKTLALLKRFIYWLAKFWTYFGKFYMVLGKCSVLQMAKFCARKLAIWSNCVTLCQWTYERLSKHGTSRSSMTWSSLFRLSMHIRSSWSGGPKRLPRPAVLFSQNSDSCSLRFFRALALAFQNNFLKTVSLSKSSWSPL